MSAFSDHVPALIQTDAGRAMEIWRQTLLETLSFLGGPGPVGLDLDWIVKFHGGTVDMPLVPFGDYVWPTDFGCAVFPAVWDSEDKKLGDSEFPFAVITALYWEEPLDVRKPVEASVEDAMLMLSAAAMSQRTLVWKTEFVAAPPSPAIVKGGPGLAVHRLPTAPAVFERFYDEERECQTVLASLETAWSLTIQSC